MGLPHQLFKKSPDNQLVYFLLGLHHLLGTFQETEKNKKNKKKNKAQQKTPKTKQNKKMPKTKTESPKSSSNYDSINH